MRQNKSFVVLIFIVVMGIGAALQPGGIAEMTALTMGLGPE